MNDGRATYALTWGDVIHEAVRSVLKTVALGYRRKVRLYRNRLGSQYEIVPHGVYEVFRETQREAVPDQDQCVLVIGFRLRYLRSNRLGHWAFQRACILTTPFWAGFPGFRIKLWMVAPATCDYLGIYRWGEEQGARTYVSTLVRVLTPLSTQGSVWYELLPATDFDDYLAARLIPNSNVATAERGFIQPYRKQNDHD